MTAAIAVAACLVAYVLGYRVYSRFLAGPVYGLDPSRRTPAHEFADDRDFMPTRPTVLFGHHFASITGLAPMLGPAVAVIWGWLPAMLWVVFGALFVGCVHDFSALVLSVRHKGMSIGVVAEDLLGRRAKCLFHLVIFFGVSLAMGVFVLYIAQLFEHESYPQAILPSGGLMVIAMIIGLLLHSGRVSLGKSTAVGFVLLLGLIYTAVQVGTFGLSADQWPSSQTFKYCLLGYGLLASVLPIWALLQPRDFINSLLLYVGLLAMYVGFFMSGNDFAAPALVLKPEGAPPLFPFVFIIIACGAASGFHALVASGTTSKQLDNELHARPIGYGGMIAESLLGLLAVIACTAGVLGPDAWTGDGVYSSWAAISGGPALGNFIRGGGAFLTQFGLATEVAVSFVAVVVVSFALTTLDSATRLLRYNIEEICTTLRWPRLGTRYSASLLAVAAIWIFAFYEVTEEKSVHESVVGADGLVTTQATLVQTTREAGIALWELFGTTNQLLAGLTLLLATRYLARRGKILWATAVPMFLMLASTLVAMVEKVASYARGDNRLLLVVGSLLFVLAVWVCVEGVLATLRDRTRQPS
ncbi:MAG: carbon starvation protein A [Planctomycetota bacterium]|nr:carbon starvation protein A [Planctomycetota bacterium]